jgi:pimeloyl-ACP methyl ester carboxylesterase
VASDVEVDVGTEVARIFGENEPDEAVAIVPPPPQGAKAKLPAAAKSPEAAPKHQPNPTPLARRIAREHNLDLNSIVGTGPRGRIVRDDLLTLLKGGGNASLSATSVGDPSSTRLAVAAVEGDALNAVWMRSGEGLTIVLLHGFSADLNNWRGMLAAGRISAPVLALDLPGHGNSPRAIPADLDAAAALVESTLAGLGVGPAVLCGHSFGGAVAARLAQRARIDARGICLISPAGLGPAIDGGFVEGILRAQTAESLRPWLEYLSHNPSHISDAFLRAVVQQRSDHGLTEAMSNFARHFFPDATQTFSIRSDLAAIRYPVRVVFGRQDRVLPAEYTRGLPGNVGLHLVDECGHMPHLERPDLMLAIIQEVWRSA